MISRKHILSSLTMLSMFSNCLIADEVTHENAEASIDEHVSVRSRDKDPEKRELMDRLRAKEAAEAENNKQPEPEASLQKANFQMGSSNSQFMFAPRQMTKPELTLAAYTFPLNCHWLTSIADTYRSVEIEDGSHWEVSPMDSYILRNWRREDSLVITPNSSWLCPYDYYITNKNNNSYVKANLVVGPLAHGPYSHWIVDVDYFGGHVALENQMRWCVSPQDSHILKEWAVNDHIIFGLYESWFSPFDHILINVNMDNFIHVKQY